MYKDVKGSATVPNPPRNAILTGDVERRGNSLDDDNADGDTESDTSPVTNLIGPAEDSTPPPPPPPLTPPRNGNGGSFPSLEHSVGVGDAVKVQASKASRGQDAEYENADYEDDDGDEEDEEDAEWANDQKALGFEFRIQDFDSVRVKAKEEYEDNRNHQREEGNGQEGREDRYWRMRSDSFTDPGGFKWGLLVFPSGNSKHMGEYLACYLEVRDIDALVEKKGSSWSLDRYKYRLRVVNHRKKDLPAQNGTSGVSGGALSNGSLYNHKTNKSVDDFSPEHPDWGFDKIIKLSSVSKESGFLDQAGDLLLRADVTPSNTGYAGLHNDGATCYLNALLQTLFMIGALRLAVYQTDTSRDVRKQGVMLELQRLFWELQKSEKAVSTRPLTVAFGWAESSLLQQHDVQEMNRGLIEKIEDLMKGTQQENTIKELFTGKARSYVKCINVDFTSVKDEEFNDIQLDVKNMENVHQAFAKYVEEEKLDGDNQYLADGHGKQDALKGVRFLSFPPVLNLHLKRFEFNMQVMQTVKINDEFKFPYRLVLDKYLHDDVKAKMDPDAPPEYEYVLQSVLVHMGHVNAGHYYAFINDFKLSANNNMQVDDASLSTSTRARFPAGYTSRWLKFDDHSVSHVPKKEAVRANFGGNTSTANAYMLVYVQVKKLAQVLIDVPDSRVPRALLERFKRDEDDEEKERQAAELKRSCLRITVVTDAGLREHGVSYARAAEKRRKRLYYDFADFGELPTVWVKKTASTAAMYKKIGELVGVADEKDIRLWSFVQRDTLNIRPDAPIDNSRDITCDKAVGPAGPFYAVFVEMRPPSKYTSHPPRRTGTDDSKKAEQQGEPRSDFNTLEPALKRAKLEAKPGPFLDPSEHILFAVREFVPAADNVRDKIRHLCCTLVRTDMYLKDLVPKVIIPALRQAGESDLETNVQDYLVWDMVQPRKLHMLSGWLGGAEDGDLGDAMHPYAEDDQISSNAADLTNGDVILFQRVHGLKPEDRKHANEIVKMDRWRAWNDELVKASDGGAWETNIPSIRSLSTPKAYLFWQSYNLVVSFMEYSSTDMSTRTRIGLNFTSKIEAVLEAVEKMLVKKGEIVPEKPHHVQLYRAISPFCRPQQAHPLELVPSDYDKSLRLMLWHDFDSRNLSVWNGPGDAEEETGEGAEKNRANAQKGKQESFLFYEVLPCPKSERGSCYEVHLARSNAGFQPSSWRTLIVSTFTENDREAGNTFKSLSNALTRQVFPLGTETLGGPEGVPGSLRWLVVNRRSGKVEKVFSHNEPGPLSTLVKPWAALRENSSPLDNPRLVADIVRPEEAEEERTCNLLTDVRGPHLDRHYSKEDNAARGPGLDPLVVVHHFFAKDGTESDTGRVDKLVGLPFTLVLRPHDSSKAVIEKALCRIGAPAQVVKHCRVAFLDGDGGFTMLDPGAVVRDTSQMKDWLSQQASKYPRLGIFHPDIGQDGGDDDLGENNNKRLRRDGVHSPIISGST